MTSIKERLNWLDDLRAISIVSVVVLHVSALIVIDFNSDASWWTANVYNSLSRFCVPVFVMITGALLLNPESENWKLFYRKRFLRVVLPFVFWSIVYLAYKFYIKYPSPELDSVRKVCTWIFFRIATGTSFHFWYIYLLICLYAIIPFLSRIVRIATMNQLLTFLALWFILIGINEVAALFSKKLYLNYFPGYIGYLILGFVLSKHPLPAIIRYRMTWLFVFGIIVTITGTYYFSTLRGNFNVTLYEYLTMNVCMQAIGVFMFFHSITRSQYLNKVIQWLSMYSYGIYLVHILVLISYAEFGLDGYFVHPAIGIPLTTITCLVLSSCIVAIISKLPVGKYLVG